MARKELGDLLVEQRIIDAAALRTANNEKKKWGGSLSRTLIETGLVPEETLVQVMSKHMNVPVADLDNLDIPANVIVLLTADFAEANSMVPIDQPMKFLDIATANPNDPNTLAVIEALQVKTRLNVRTYIAGPRAIERAIRKYYNRGVGAFGQRVMAPRASEPAIGDRFAPPPSVKVAPVAIASAVDKFAPPPAAPDPFMPPAIESAADRFAPPPAAPPPPAIQMGPVLARVDQLVAEISKSEQLQELQRDELHVLRQGVEKLAAALASTEEVLMATTSDASQVQARLDHAEALVARSEEAVETATTEIQQLRTKVEELQALVERDEAVLKELLNILVERGVATREEILGRLR